eukprot:NODE_1836_length_741_cov_61.774566_g1429_i0.p1 GENE.NODE_1836_length_741_cov_61.774566_g1429_i0~~NODE_1836_length_741_cov_61.774566_g1429_i0.p1  ORF type:complete len:196 (+),score=47.12 NODE_1836_length_741_cov_61.774566_g1429_i0:88-675(+)
MDWTGVDDIWSTANDKGQQTDNASFDCVGEGGDERGVDLPPISVPTTSSDKRLTLGKQKTMVNRLYSQPLVNLQRRAELEEEALNRLYTPPVSYIDRNREADLIHRMCHEQRERDRLVNQQLTEKYIQPRPRRPLALDEEKKSTQRMYYERKKAKEEKMEALLHKWVTSRDPPPARRLSFRTQDFLLQRLVPNGT